MSGEDTLDIVLRRALWYGMGVALSKELGAIIGRGSGGDVIIAGSFVFEVNCHSTGNSVSAWIVHDGKGRKIIRTTYWFSSRYTFNESLWERGAWDEALNAEIGRLRRAVSEAREQEEQRKREREAREEAERQEEKLAWEKLFDATAQQ